MKADVYTRVTDKIVADLENGVRTWLKPWNAEHAAGRITRPHSFGSSGGHNSLKTRAKAMNREK